MKHTVLSREAPPSSSDTRAGHGNGSEEALLPSLGALPSCWRVFPGMFRGAAHSRCYGFCDAISWVPLLLLNSWPPAPLLAFPKGQNPLESCPWPPGFPVPCLLPRADLIPSHEFCPPPTLHAPLVRAVDPSHRTCSDGSLFPPNNVATSTTSTAKCPASVLATVTVTLMSTQSSNRGPHDPNICLPSTSPVLLLTRL